MKLGKLAASTPLLELPTSSEPVISPKKPLELPELPSYEAPAPTKTTTPSGKRLHLNQAHKQLEAPPLSIVSATPLNFDAPFGEGADRHAGVRAASALVKLGDAFVIAQDDSAFAAIWSGASVTPLRLFEGGTFSSAQGNKAQKPDLELGATFSVGGQEAAVLFGSGSTDARTRAVWIVKSAEGFEVQTRDLSSLYAAAMRRLGIDESALNLEGAAAVGDKVFFFQRGNGAGGVNASFSVSSALLEAALLEGAPIRAQDLRDVRKHALGELDGCPLGFSDAAPLPDGRVLFLAAAEASPNTYDDGAVAGSVIGVLDHDGSAKILHRVPEGPYKLEGLAVEKVEGGVVHLRAVEDADDPSKASTALSLRLALT